MKNLHLNDLNDYVFITITFDDKKEITQLLPFEDVENVLDQLVENIFSQIDKGEF